MIEVYLNFFFYQDIMHYLLDNFADVNSQNRAGDTPIFLASDTYNRECAKVN